MGFNESLKAPDCNTRDLFVLRDCKVEKIVNNTNKTKDKKEKKLADLDSKKKLVKDMKVNNIAKK
jgi:hypothetical protein